MAAYNHLVIVGNLTRDPDLKYTPKGKAVCDFDVAVNHSYKDSEGNKKEEVCFVPVTVWGKTAETTAEFMKKGRLILVEGRLLQERWESKEGNKRTRLKLSGNNVVFLGTPPKREESKNPPVDGKAQDDKK